MAEFRDQEAASRALDRIAELVSPEMSAGICALLDRNVSPDLALTNLERWLGATGNPSLQGEQLLSMPVVARDLLDLLGCSQPIADILIQNPDLSGLLWEPAELQKRPSVEQVIDEGTRLLEDSISHSHSLDRLRYLRQRWMLTITLNDLSGRWSQPVVWQALSDLADGLVKLAVHQVWSEFRKQKDLPEVAPVAVIAFGKLGGHELNYSSDIDLTFVLSDEADEALEKQATRFCESISRALSDRMGRGALYRVDLRLRPYGATGALIRRMKSYEGYYESYAELWEIQALLRTRCLVNFSDIEDRWNALRVLRCFRPKRTELALQEMFETRERIESLAPDDDIKRASGGIRDVEFLTQALQMLHGFDEPDCQQRTTLNALAALGEHGFLESPVVEALAAGYEFLRKLEHRVQLVGDRQTHELPATEAARTALAKTMGLEAWPQLERELKWHRRTIQTLYRSTLNLDPGTNDPRDRVATALGVLAPVALQWFDVLPEREAFYSGLIENEGSLRRVQKILEIAPALVNRFKASVPLTELLLSGEIEEFESPTRRIQSVAKSADLAVLAGAYSNSIVKAFAAFIFDPSELPNLSITAINQCLLQAVLDRLGSKLTVIALGSFGNGEMSYESDLDLLLLVEHSDEQAEAEKIAQLILSTFSKLNQHGTDLGVDLRLRPDGSRGLLVRTLAGFQAYQRDGLELWERFALGHARLIAGSKIIFQEVLEAAYGLPITPNRLENLIQMKRRIETERVVPELAKRQIKLGTGGLGDIEWLVHLHEMRYPTATNAKGGGPFMLRIRNLAHAQLINALECEFLMGACRHLLETRLRLQLLGFDGDMLPENPDKLERLARATGDETANTFLSRHEPIVDGVRRLYLESLDRLLH